MHYLSQEVMIPSQSGQFLKTKECVEGLQWSEAGWIRTDLTFEKGKTMRNSCDSDSVIKSDRSSSVTDGTEDTEEEGDGLSIQFASNQAPQAEIG